MRSLIWTILCTLAAASCVISPRRGGYNPYATNGPMAGQSGGYTQGSDVTSPPSGNAQAQLNALAQYLGQQGASIVGPAVHGALQQNGLIAYQINVSAGACYTIAVIGETSADINIYVLDQAGATIGYDVRPDGHPWASFCPSVSGRAVTRLQMAHGEGGYYYVAFQGPPQRGRADLASFFGGAREQGPATASMDPATTARLNALDQQLATDNYHRLGPPAGLVFAQQEQRDFQLNLQGGQCYAFATIGGPTARDTDVFLVDGVGNTLGQDTGTNVDGLVRYCAPRTGTYTMRARMYAGSGPLFAVGYQQSAAQAPPQANTPGGVMATTSTASAGLDENFQLLDGDMHARGYEPLGNQERGSLAEGQSHDFDLTFEGGKCYAVLAVGDNGVRDLDLKLLDARGQLVDRDVQTDPRPIVRVCPTSSGTYRMQVVMSSGAGNFVYAAYRWPRGTRGPFGLNGLMYVRLAEVSSLLRVEGYQPDETMSIERGSLRHVGEEHQHTVTLQGGQCYSILTVGAQGLNDIDLSLVGNGTTATDGSRNAFPNVRACAQTTGHYELTVKAADGAGDYAFQVFRRGAT